MAVRRNIPGTYATINDKNLTVLTESDAPNVVVLGTAAAGPAYEPIPVGNFQQFRGATLGGLGSLVDGLHLVETTQTQSVLAVRINSREAKIQGIGGDSHRIQTVLQDDTAGSAYKVAYDATTNRLQVVDALDRIVYDNNPGGTPTDEGEVLVRGVYTNGTVSVGVIGEQWVSLETLGTGAPIVVTDYVAAQTSGTTSDSFTVQAGTVISGPFTVVVGTNEWQDTTGDGTFDTFVGDASAGSVVQATGVVSLTWSSAPAVGEDIEVSYTYSFLTTAVAAEGVTEAYSNTNLANDTISFTLANSRVAQGTVVLTDEQGAVDVVWTDQGDGTLTPAGAGTEANGISGTIDYITGDVVLIYDAPIDLANGAAADVTVAADYGYFEDEFVYQAGADGLSASKPEFFQSMRDAYYLFESVDFDVVLPAEGTLDCPNVADLASSEITARGLDIATLDVSNSFPTKDSTQDVLGRMVVESYKGRDYYFWVFDVVSGAQTTAATFKAQVVPTVFGLTPAQQTTLNTGQYGIAEAIKETASPGSGTQLALSQFKEVNFAWETAYFCYRLEVNDNSATCVIGVEPPLSFLAEDVDAWIGDVPTIDLDGDITVDGTGLLGNKFSAGTTTHGAGFWATESGYFPTGSDPSSNADVILDTNENPVQIGKYLSLTATPVVQTALNDVFGVGTVVNLALLYGGAYANLPEDIGMTNKSIAGVRVPFRLSKLQAELLRDAGYVTMYPGRNGTVVVEDKLATLSDSDFQNLTTIRIATQLLEDARDALFDYIGRGMTDARLAAMNRELTNVLSRYQREQKVTFYEGKVLASRQDRVLGRATAYIQIAPAFQLKIINLELSLSDGDA